MTESRRPPTGCAMFGIYSGMFGRRRRSASMSSLSRINGSPPAAADEAAAPAHAGHRKAGVHDDSSLPQRPNALTFPGTGNAAVAAAPRATPSSNGNGRAAANGGGKAAAEYTGMAAELDKMIHDHQRVKGTTQLVRATSGNMMLHRNLGNLNAAVPGAAPVRSPPERNPKPANERKGPNGYAFSGLGNIVKEVKAAEPPASKLCRALSHRTDPETLKEMGNEAYREGHYAEAVALYDQAIIVDPARPAYWSNKAAALAALGRLIDAVGDCKEALRVDPSFGRAHHRLGGLYLRLGEPDKAIHHFQQQPANESVGADVSRARSVKSLIAKCTDARKLKDWHTVLQESRAAVSDGADCAPQVMAFQAEALLKLQRHDEADTVFTGGAPWFGVDESTKFFGTTGHAYVLMVRAQVDMAAGRFEDAVATAQTAWKLDTSNREVAGVHVKAKDVLAARLRGNDLFRASSFAAACAEYGEGLERQPGSAVLLCNRAACYAKLGRYEKAIEDCNAALAVRPAYSKARLRRADCNVKLERWEASLRDYQVLIQELPENADVKKALSEVEAKLKSQRDGDKAQQ